MASTFTVPVQKGHTRKDSKYQIGGEVSLFFALRGWLGQILRDNPNNWRVPEDIEKKGGDPVPHVVTAILSYVLEHPSLDTSNVCEWDIVNTGNKLILVTPSGTHKDGNKILWNFGLQA